MAEQGVELAGYRGLRLHKPPGPAGRWASARQSVVMHRIICLNPSTVHYKRKSYCIKILTKKRRRKGKKQAAHAQSHWGCPVRQGCFLRGVERPGLLWRSSSPLPSCDLQLPPPQQGQLGPTTYISSPTSASRFQNPAPTGMSSASSGVSEVDVVSLKCHRTAS